MNAISLLMLIGGLLLLVFGAEVLVRGASATATRLKVSPLVIGMTVVAYGTSAPELSVSVRAALEGNSGIAVGNVVGSNTFNALFILGLSAVILPLTVQSRILRLDIPVMIGVSALFMLLTLNNRIGPIEGIGLLLGLFAFTALNFFLGRREKQQPGETVLASVSRVTPLWRSVIYILVGLIVLVAGARFFVDGAVWLAEWVGIGEIAVGLIIVAAGTSMPEVVTSVVAAVRGQSDIAIGNVVGSNIFNLLGVMGITSLVAPSGVDVPQSILHFDLPVMLAAAVIVLPLAFTGGKISRREGGLLLGYMLAYSAYILLRASDHDSLRPYSIVMVVFVVPLTVIAIVSMVVRELVSRKARSSGESGGS